MASVINAVRNITSDNMWIVKLAVLTIPAFFIFNDENMMQTILNENIPILLALIILYLGCASVMMNRNINNKMPIFPGIFTIPEVILRGICTTIVALPGSAILTAVCYFIKENVVLEEPLATFILYVCVIAFMSPFIFVPMALYSVNGKISDAMKLNKVFAASGNFVVAILSFVIQYVFIVLLFTYLVYKLLFEMLGEGNIGISILFAFIIVVSIFLVFSYISDLYGDVIPTVKSKRDIL